MRIRRSFSKPKRFFAIFPRLCDVCKDEIWLERMVKENMVNDVNCYYCHECFVKRDNMPEVKPPKKP